MPFSYIGAPPFWGEGIAGVIIHGIHLKNSGGTLTNVAYEGQICGRLYESSTDRRLMLNAIYCDEYEKKSSEQVYATFQKIDRILRTFGFQYKEVLRTWIYIPEILDYYAAFNKARNQFFEELNILPKLDEVNDFERIFMPASTGVGCENPYSNVALFDVYAISKSVRGSELKIYIETGSEQRSAYRYGSAFSRSIIVSAQ
ncbi:enamine deaminase RidA (YjgF/YER057c/UK114 family) [Fontibacillus solani]|uniref:Enamine deaminase RidA (YjgF/YER057c/UK114 family) n=1 Tax=Fontibacillus solani TaxID=1572857 RepID=A0A7W3SZ95_9BACL|nr:RidA family protein [Fontibacillus solani]MBA9088673.1 enamine deaminase RidA (YjgF/YER057c/UK114 family) [Fontibacillus solani]